MHDLRFLPLASGDVDALAAWLAAEPWPFHVFPRLTEDDVRRRFRDGAFTGEDHETFWIVSGAEERVGLLRIDDLLDPCQVFDLRVRSAHRGRGIATSAVRWLADRIFLGRPDAWRIEGQTREDNAAMRRVFDRCGWAKEAVYREAWPTADGRRLASIGYGLLRGDWARGVVTPVPWRDEP